MSEYGYDYRPYHGYSSQQHGTIYQDGNLTCSNYGCAHLPGFVGLMYIIFIIATLVFGIRFLVRGYESVVYGEETPEQRAARHAKEAARAAERAAAISDSYYSDRLTLCNECGKPIAKTARNCPHCGAHHPGGIG